MATGTHTTMQDLVRKTMSDQFLAAKISERIEDVLSSPLMTNWKWNQVMEGQKSSYHFSWGYSANRTKKINRYRSLMKRRLRM